MCPLFTLLFIPGALMVRYYLHNFRWHFLNDAFIREVLRMSNSFEKNTFFTLAGHLLCVRLCMSEPRAHVPTLIRRNTFALDSWVRSSFSLWTWLLGMVNRTRTALMHLLVSNTPHFVCLGIKSDVLFYRNGNVIWGCSLTDLFRSSAVFGHINYNIIRLKHS